MDDPIEVTSLCMNCEKEGLNKIVKINIPYFKDVLIHSFECTYCNYKNNVIQDLNKIKDKGIKITLNITKEELLNRQLIKSDYCIFKIPEIDFEIPKETQKGSINTIEGFINTAILSLKNYLSTLKLMYVNDTNQNYINENKTEINTKINTENENNINNIENKDLEIKNLEKNEITIENYMNMIENTIKKLSEYIYLKKLPIIIEIIDPSGLSSFEYYEEDIKNKTVIIENYERTKEELHELGFYEDLKNHEIEKTENINHIDKKENFDFIKKYINVDNPNEIKYKTITYESTKLIESFSSNCPCCNYLGSNNFCEVTIPGFKKCLILSYVCDNCNYKTSEIKNSGEISKKGKKIILNVQNKNDLNRFVIKSETASIQIPKFQFISDYGALGGLLTTIEGIIYKIIESLEEKFKFLLGDSYNIENETSETNETVIKIKDLINNLYKICKTDEIFPFDFIIDDIASNSFISKHEEEKEDENLKEEEYERTFEQNDLLGLIDMKTENY